MAAATGVWWINNAKIPAISTIVAKIAEERTLLWGMIGGYWI
jgi:hypothetical protein